jgi:hypothetical protein
MFQNLYGTRVPTGDPSCPPHVCRAKAIQQMINQKLEYSDGNADDEVEAEEYTDFPLPDDPDEEEEYDELSNN